jgi:diguanylate cyclase (GGDEF)-like protein
MKSDKAISILSLFCDIVIFELDGEGIIKKTIMNTKNGFNDTLASDIKDLFCLEDRERVEKLFKKGVDDSKRYVKLASKFRINEFVDVNIATYEGDIYLALEFFESDRERELEYDRKIEQFADMAELDPLTGLLNRYGYWDRVKKVLDCGDSDRKLGILFVDMDKLKIINDEKGHEAGDRAINQISNLISSHIRKRDIGVRYGGDEFIIVVEEMTGKNSTAYGLANRLLRIIKENRKSYLTTVSIGVHIVRVGDFEKYLKDEAKLRKLWDESIEVADKMAQKAKDSGRNRVVFSGNID